MTVTTNGTAPVTIIFFTLEYKSVSVTAATKMALDETGEHLSPKNEPEMIAPAAALVLTPPPFASTMSTTPMVPMVPKLVPRANETRHDNKNANKIK